MKKLIFIFLVMFCSNAYGAVSADMSEYVRKDVFEARMDKLDAKMDRVFEELKSIRDEQKILNEELKSRKQEINDLSKNIAVLSQKVDNNFITLNNKIDANFITLNNKIDSSFAILDKKIDGNFATLNSKIDGNFETLSARIDRVDSRVEDLRSDIYLGLVVLGIIVALPSVKSFFQWWEERKALRSPSFTLEDIERLMDSKINQVLLKGSINQ